MLRLGSASVKNLSVKKTRNRAGFHQHEPETVDIT